MSGTTRTPGSFYSSRRDVPINFSSTRSTPPSFRPSEDEIFPYQPHESLLDNPSRWQDALSDEDGGHDLDNVQNRNPHFSTSASSTSAVFRNDCFHSPLQSTSVHNQPVVPPSRIVAMLQQQQELLQKLLSQQEEMKAQQNILSHKVAKLEENFHTSSCSSSPAASRKVKNRVTRDLKVVTTLLLLFKVYYLHLYTEQCCSCTRQSGRRVYAV